MSRKHFSWLLFMTFIVAALVLMVPGKTGKESSIEQKVFLPGAAAKVNEIEWLRLTSAGNVTVATLKREGTAWIVEEASGYRADWDRLKTLLTGLSQAKVIEMKTANSEYYPRLGVENVSLPEAGGVMIEFSADSGLPALIIGKSAQGRDGQYARLRDSVESTLIDRRIDVSATRSDWLDKTIVDISDAEVVEVAINHPDGESIKALKYSADDENFKLQDIPEGKEIKSDWTVNTLGGALAALSLESVAPDDDFDWNDAIRFRLLTADGLLLESELLAVEADETTEGEYWIRLQAGLYTTAFESQVGAVDDATGTSARAEAINKRVKGWAYRIPEYTFDLMTRRKDDLLQSELP
jgi:hypothetical protein